MPNYFDQFDAASTQSGNFFDRFDQPAAKSSSPAGMSDDQFMKWAENQSQKASWQNGVYHSPLSDEDYARYSALRARGGRAKEAADAVGEGVLRSAQQGATFGFGDEATAAMRALMNGEDYNSALADERQRLADFRAAHPYMSYGAELAAGAAVPVGVSADALKAGVTAGQIAKTGLKTGAVVGALSGYGTGEGDVGERALNSGVNAGAGAALGTTIPLAAYGLIKGGSTIANAVRNAADPKRAAVQEVVGAMDQAGLSWPDIAAHMGEGKSQSDVPFTLVDAARAAAAEQGRTGANIPLTNLARNAAGTGGQAEQRAMEALESRQMNQGDRLNTVFKNAVNGGDRDAELARLNGIIDQQANAAYRNAHANQQPYDVLPALQDYATKHADVLQTNSDLGAGMRKALKLFTLRDDAGPGGANAVTLPPPGTKMSASDYQALLQRMEQAAQQNASGDNPVSTLSQFQAAKQSLDNMITASRKGGEDTPLTNRLQELRAATDKAVKSTNPEYANADTIFSGARTAQDLLALGQKGVLRAGPAQDEALARFSTMTPEQKDVFRIGVARNMQNAVNNLNDGSTVAAKQFNREAFRNFIQKTFEPDQADQLLTELGREGISSRTLPDVFGNSRTAPMAYGLEGLAEDAKLAGNLLALNPHGVAQGLGNKYTRKYTGQKAENIINMMMNADPHSPASNAIQDEAMRLLLGSQTGSPAQKRLAATLIGTGASAPRIEASQ